MRRLAGTALVVLALASCRSPGDRLEVNGRLEPVTHPALGLLHLATDGERFFWAEGGHLRARAVTGGAETVLADVDAAAWAAPALTREHVAVFAGASVVVVPKQGGAPRHIVAHDAIVALGATAHALVWTTTSSDVVALDLREEGAAPRAVAHLAEPRVVLAVVGSPEHDIFAVLSRTEDGAFRFDAGDALASAPLRNLHAFPRRPGPGAVLDDDFVSVALGRAHLFVTPPASSLYPSPTELLAVPLAGGASASLGEVCPNTLSVLGDDPVALAKPRSGRCPGEFPQVQTLALVRIHVGDTRRETLYAAYTGSITSAPAGAHAVLLGERVPLPHPEGSAPRYDSRTARLGAL